MDLPWGDDKTTKFATTIGLITSDGPNGPNIMASEWTHQVSYSPGLISISIGKDRTSRENILASREFGVSLAAEDQNVIASIAGGSHGKEVDKISVLKELGFKFYNARKIRTLMIEGAALHLECKVVQVIELGNRTTIVGEVQEATANGKKPLLYHGLRFWRLGEEIAKPGPEMMEKTAKAVEKFRKNK